MTFNYASTTEDRQVMRAGIARVREIMRQPAFDPYRGEELAPGPAAVDDDALDAFVATHGESAYHPCGTCRMGRSDDAVVDADGRVYGTDNLRVIDASVMPEITNGNLNAPVLMLAEKMISAIADRSSRSGSGSLQCD
ncbi:MAG: GMC oxidoreductase [Gammaproteobacteria bacterium]|nr:GMC oxidoreductase [Gammaproteobacteria bacterium]